MYNKLLNIIENEKDKKIVNELTVIKNRIKRGDSPRSTIYESYICMKEMIIAPIDNEYKKCLEKTIEIIDSELLPLMEIDIEQEEKDKIIKDIINDNNKFRKQLLKNAKINDSIPLDLIDNKKNMLINNDIEGQKNNNKIALILKICAVIEGVFGYFFGITLLYYYINMHVYISFISIILYFIFIALIICFTLAISEIIQILHDIRKKLLK